MKKIASLLAAAVMTIMIPLNAAALSYESPALAKISYTNAPEGTVYMDILVKMPVEDASYVDFTQPPEYSDLGGSENIPLDITADSEIAKYNEDGYVSLSLHHKWAKPFVIYSNSQKTERSDPSSCELEMSANGDTTYDFIDLSISFGDYKAAYVDEHGNILGVTSASVTEYDLNTPYGFSADGDSLVFLRHGAHPRTIAIIVAVTGIVLISLPITLAFLYSKRKKRIKASDLAMNARDNLK